MTRFKQVFCALAAAIGLLPATPAVGQDEPAGHVSSQLLSTTNQMWLLLSSVVDRDTADAAAERFQTLVEQSSVLSDKLFDADAQAQDVEALDQDAYRIAEAYEDLSYEFESLCRVRCYGSAKLVEAFAAAMRLGVFSDEHEEYLLTSTEVVSEEATQAEIERLKRLEPHDQKLVQVLASVQDAQTASAAVQELHSLAERLQLLQPRHYFRIANFPDILQENVQSTCDRLEPILWRIRSEIVRVVGLPGYDHELFDTFSDALDAVFESLSNTHSECFDDVFDSSFRADLDDALHESSNNSQH